MEERGRCSFVSFPFKKIPKQMIIHLVYNTVFWINLFPQGQDVSDTMGSRPIMNGLKPSMAHVKYQFGQYFQKHEESNNSMSERTLDALFVGPIDNNQGGFDAFNLKTGQQIKRTHATMLPATNTVVKRVHAMVIKDKMSNGLIFGDQVGNTTINDLDPIANAEEDDASDNVYSIENDF